ncbi:GDSL-type esterase/lipase family protein [Marinilabilia salmonicolor]|jgi:lysophospholipase L1-like esterase|uniref:Lysophospholipase L1-like esterase n=1 Tax=Marinilabilia salmonicolor TaxID=989 RepID=A0A2T0XRS1_9BACT|nr:GDSL-type esterase/lipase family protein [Marinilabilia salmonicolor]PRZ01645.1 lysophospholipase L1-like esterase [Marinilabilia salmonicolor]RCW31585.1 lysophospholipase L1-like esterase [Marinilabilia salmonicolor]
MKNTKYLLLFLFIVSALNARTQEAKYSTYYYQRASLFEQLQVDNNDIIFLGNSITDGGEWAELFNNPNVKNRGISGDITTGVYDRLDAILKGQPEKIFLLIGINDVARGLSVDSIVDNIALIAETVKRESPATQLFLQSVLPVNDEFPGFKGHTSRYQMVPEINKKLKLLARKKNVTYIDLFSHFVDQSGIKMDKKYTNDGLHLMGEGYMLWRDIIASYLQ